MEGQETETTVNVSEEEMASSNDTILQKVLSLKRENLFQDLHQGTAMQNFTVHREERREHPLNSHDQSSGEGWEECGILGRIMDHTCKDCRKQFTNQRDLQSHICLESSSGPSTSKPRKRAEKRSKEMQSPKKNPLHCNICGRSFKQFAAFLRHAQVHDTDAISSHPLENPPENPVRQGQPKHRKVGARTGRQLPPSAGNSSQTFRKKKRFQVQMDFKNKIRSRLSKVAKLSGRESQDRGNIINLKSGGKNVQGSASRSDKYLGDSSSSGMRVKGAASSSSLEASSLEGRGKGDIALEDPLRLCAIQQDASARQKPSSSNNSNLSGAWDMLASLTKDLSSESHALSVKHSETPGSLGESSSAPSTHRSDPAEVKLVRKELLGMNLNVQEKERIANKLRMLGMVSLLHDNVNEVRNRLLKPGDIPKGSTVAEGTFKASSVSSASDPEYCGNSSTGGASDQEDESTMKNGKSNSSEPRVRRSRKVDPAKTFCDICQKDFTHLNKHMLVHNSTRSFKCDECGKAFYEHRVLVKHQTTHVKRYKCSVCDERFSKLRAARQHAKVHMAEKPYVCEVCEYPFRTRRDLRKHVTVHSSVREYICHVCGHACRTASALRNHSQKHVEGKPFVCETCGKAFKYSSGLRTHSFTHTTGTPYRCQFCLEAFKHNYMLKRHLLTHEGEQSPFKRCKQPDKAVSEFMKCEENKYPEKATEAGEKYAGGPSTSNLFVNVQRSLQPPSAISPSDASGILDSISHDPMTQAQQETEHEQQQLQNYVELPLMQSDTSDTTIPKTSRIKRTLGPAALKKPLSGTGSRRQTVEASLVTAICDGSFKSLMELQRLDGEKST